jgi:hypothetical protein
MFTFCSVFPSKTNENEKKKQTLKLKKNIFSPYYSKVAKKIIVTVM